MTASRILTHIMAAFAVSMIASATMAFTLDPQSAGQLSHLAPHASQILQQQQKVEAPAADASRVRTYESAQGPIDLAKFENVISNFLRGTSITIQDIRWPYNPFAYSNYFVGKMFHQHMGYENTWYATYVVSMKVAREHDTVCELTVYVTEPKARLWNCRSSTAKVKVYLDFKYEDVGMPVKDDGKPTISENAVTGPQ